MWLAATYVETSRHEGLAARGLQSLWFWSSWECQNGLVLDFHQRCTCCRLGSPGRKLQRTRRNLSIEQTLSTKRRQRGPSQINKTLRIRSQGTRCRVNAHDVVICKRWVQKRPTAQHSELTRAIGSPAKSWNHRNSNKASVMSWSRPESFLAEQGEWRRDRWKKRLCSVVCWPPKNGTPTTWRASELLASDTDSHVLRNKRWMILLYPVGRGCSLHFTGLTQMLIDLFSLLRFFVPLICMNKCEIPLVKHYQIMIFACQLDTQRICQVSSRLLLASSRRRCTAAANSLITSTESHQIVICESSSLLVASCGSVDVLACKGRTTTVQHPACSLPWLLAHVSLLTQIL